MRPLGPVTDRNLAAGKRVVALYLLLLAAATAVHLIITPFYQPDHDPDFTYWEAYDPFMMAGSLLVLLFAYLWKRRHDAALPEANNWRAYVEVNALFYIGGVQAILLAWSWLMQVFGDPPLPQPVIGLLVDSVGVMLWLAAGRRLWREAASAS